MSAKAARKFPYFTGVCMLTLTRPYVSESEQRQIENWNILCQIIPDFRKDMRQAAQNRRLCRSIAGLVRENSYDCGRC